MVSPDKAMTRHDPFKGHYKVGLSILKTNGLKRVNPIGGLLKTRIGAKGSGREQPARQRLF
jgi:hypothetical protein